MKLIKKKIINKDNKEYYTNIELYNINGCGDDMFNCYFRKLLKKNNTDFLKYTDINNNIYWEAITPINKEQYLIEIYTL